LAELTAATLLRRQWRYRSVAGVGAA
jgi:hypothetical protein